MFLYFFEIVGEYHGSVVVVVDAEHGAVVSVVVAE